MKVVVCVSRENLIPNSFLLLSNLLCFIQLKKTIHDFFSLNLVKLDLDLDPDPHSEKLLDPDPHKVNADPQPWFTGQSAWASTRAYLSKLGLGGPFKC